jgi:hypothetical protein
VTYGWTLARIEQPPEGTDGAMIFTLSTGEYRRYLLPQLLTALLVTLFQAWPLDLGLAAEAVKWGSELTCEARQPLHGK